MIILLLTVSIIIGTLLSCFYYFMGVYYSGFFLFVTIFSVFILWSFYKVKTQSFKDFMRSLLSSKMLGSLAIIYILFFLPRSILNFSQTQAIFINGSVLIIFITLIVCKLWIVKGKK